MLASIKRSLVLATVLLSGCASYSQHELASVQDWPPTANAPTEKPTVFVRTTSMYQVNGGPANAASGAPAASWDAAVTDSFRQSGRFARVSTDKVESDIYVEATLFNNEQFSMVSSIITGATFFIIPSTSKNTYTLETIFKDKDGKELGRVRKSESVRTWMQLLLIVAVPFQQKSDDVVQTLARSTLDEAVKRRLL
ncbi:hypothetical protein [Pseudomonas fluorescens]|uniref:Lipoprotein n=1 Tax=Pseudomonas fluorescens TaxID=294 RepID=A0A5E7QGK0_PSEFL|nr:hypothetical protein [Pseudomonas fluorescens]VVP60645.1 hypothetical protein PS880_06181 [Pseudomonas fluorescens]